MKIAEIAPLSYKAGEMEYFQFIRGGVGADYHQGPFFYLFDDGRVRMIWTAYDFDERSPNRISLYSDSLDGGITWTSPQVYLADFSAPLGPSSILRLQDNSMALMVGQIARHVIVVDSQKRVCASGSNYFQTKTHIFIRRSLDGGYSFDLPEEIPYQIITGGKKLPECDFYGGVGSVIQLQSGRIVVGLYFLDPAISDGSEGRKGQYYTGVCLLSDDKGKSWKKSSEITVDTERGVMEPQIVEIAPDRIFALFRTRGGFLYQTRSDDGGVTWSKSEPSPLPAPESLARMITLQSGRVLVVWNNISSTTQHPRHPLVAAVSYNCGESWSEAKIIAQETGTNQLSNHGLIQLEDGKILLGISHYRHVRPMTSDLDMAIFDEEWLLK